MNKAIKLQTKPERRYDIDALHVLAVLLCELIKLTTVTRIGFGLKPKSALQRRSKMNTSR